MLTLVIEGEELFNEKTQEFTATESVVLTLEHSLLSLSKWESLVKRPFLSKVTMSSDETLLYIEAMILSPIYPPDIAERFTMKHLDIINDYIASPESATTFGPMPEGKGRGETITAELIYYWMTMFNVPFECESWHLNRLLSLIRIANIKNSKPTKKSQRQLTEERKALNAKRRAELNSKG